MQHGSIQFGTFEIDVSAGELWKGGHRIRLARQPFSILLVLLERQGEVVSRLELQSRVWDSGTNVDFDRAVAGAINKIREALGDSAENPCFIQTLPKKGYRFIAPVNLVPSAVAVSAVASEHVVRTESELPAVSALAPAAADAAQSTTEGLKVSQVNRSLFWVAMALFLMLCIVVFRWQTGRVAGPPRIDQVTRDGKISVGPPSLENLITLATDGNRILTSEMRGGQPQLSAISISTGDTQAIALPESLSSSLLADISPDKTRLLLKSHSSSDSEQPLWIVPSSGGSGLRVGSVVAHDAAWMPDGSSILYSSGDELSVLQLNTGVSTLLARVNGRAFWMRWSPEGRLLRFTLQDPTTHSSSIWELRKGESLPRRVHTPAGSTACCGTWTADGKAYIFTAGDNLWSLQGNGFFSQLRQLSNGPLRFSSPAAAQQGSGIFFVGLDPPAGMQLYDERDGFHPAPAFLADATRVEYSRDEQWVAWTDHDEKLWRARAADGSDRVRLTPEYMETFMARWEPDGKRVAVMAREPGSVWKIYLVDRDGGTPVPLLADSRNEADPSWSPDGQYLVYGREPDTMGKENASHTLGLVRLSDHSRISVPGSEKLFSPRWSPDGRWIAALTLDQKSVWLFDVKAQHWTELAAVSAADPAWSSDSQALYVHAFQTAGQPLLRITVPDGHLTTITDLTQLPNQATNYFFGGLTPKNQILIQPHVGSGSLYYLDLSHP